VQAPNGYEVAAHYTPALEVSGDYYDIIQLGDDRIGLLAADVSGKGVPGLVVMAMLRVVLRGLARGDRRPMDVLASSQRMLKGTMRKGMFVTCLYGVLDARSHRFDYASAGHCPPLLYGASRSRWLEAGGKPIGLFEDRMFESSLREQQVVLQPDECLLLYTDGLVEAMNMTGDQLGEDPVAQLLTGHGADPPSVSVDRLRKCVKKHRGDRLPTDDLTLVVLRRLQLQHLQRETPVMSG